MTKSDIQILILEDDACFRGILENACDGLGEVVSTENMTQVLGLLTDHPFQVLLLDWHLIRSQGPAFLETLDNFQPDALKLALFTVPDLPNVISAMKSGAADVLWAALSREALRARIQASMLLIHSQGVGHDLVSKMAEILTEKAMIQKTSLFKARREFSKTFLERVLSGQKLRRSQLASLMDVSPRTLNRHLSS